jgi:Right handed beta helix region
MRISPALTGASLALLLGIVPTPAMAAPGDVWVKPAKGSDRASGTRSKPLRTVVAAWRRAGDGTTIHVLPGRVRVGASPNYWEDKAGVRLVGHGRRGQVSLPALNMFGLTRVSLKNLTIRGDVHCERCSRWTLDRVVILAGGAQEGLKVNQSDHVKVLRSDISHASDNSLDFVAVQYATIAHNKIHRATDWCAYVKGGSAYVRVFDNELYDCGTGGFTAGQGTGLQFMTAPWFQYEAYDVRVYGNRIHDTEGAGLGVNGGYDVLLAGNSLRRVGSRSHAIEVVYGSRSCDGRPGDEGRERCGQYIEQGAWGTTAIDDGDNYIRIPNRHVFIFNNSVLKSPGADDDSIHEPYDSPTQRASNAPSPALADDDLRRGGNNFAGGAASGEPIPDFPSWEVPVPAPPTLSNQDLD